MKATPKMRRKEIPNLERIKALFKEGFTIRSLSQSFGVPYVTLYRAIHGRVDKSRLDWSNKKKGNCYFCGNKHRKVFIGKKDNGKGCEYIKRKNVIHHIDCDRSNNVKTNLVELCEVCHLRLHRGIYDKLIKAGKLKVKRASGLSRRKVEGVRVSGERSEVGSGSQ